MQNLKALSVGLWVLSLVFAFSFVPHTYAYGPEASNITEKFSGNTYSYAAVGDYHIFPMYWTLYFYSETTGEPILAKSWNLPDCGNQAGYQVTRIVPKDNDEIIVVCSGQDWGPGYHNTLNVYELNVNDLSYNTLVDAVYDGSATAYRADDFLTLAVYYNANGTAHTVYAITNAIRQVASTNYGNYWIYRVYPTQEDLGAETSFDHLNILMAGNGYGFRSETDTAEFYMIGPYHLDYDRIAVYKIDDDANNIIFLGQSGIDATWNDDYMYIFGHSYITVGSDSYYDVLYTMPNITENKNIVTGLFRFNDTYASLTYASINLTSGVNTLRPFAMRDANSTYSHGRGGVNNTTYDVVYRGVSDLLIYLDGAMMYIQMKIDDLDTATPTVTIATASPDEYLTPSINIHAYTDDTNVGGLHPVTSPICLYIDYGNDLFRPDDMQATFYVYAYSYTLSPVGSWWTELITQTTYRLDSDWTRNGLYAVQGTYNFTLDSSPLTLGAIVDSEFSVNLIFTTAGFYTLYLNLTDTVTGFSELQTFTLVVSDRLPSDPPGQVNIDPGQTGVAIISNIGSIVGMVLVFIPALVLFIFFGPMGGIMGLILGFGVGLEANIIPFWAVVVTSLALLTTIVFFKR